MFRQSVVTLVSVVTAFASQTAMAQSTDPAIVGGGTFRRVAVPGPDHTGPLINIQIEPREVSAAPTPEENGPAPDLSELDGPSGWFWSIVPARLGVDDRARAAVDHIMTAPEAASLPIATMNDLNAIIEAHGRDILGATINTEVSPALALAVIAVESAGRVDAVSHAGAQGLMQLIPATADRFGVEDPFDPSQNIAGGVAYLDWLLNEFNQDPVLALAGYNAGEGAVRDNNGVPPYRETRDYVPKVLATWARLRILCSRVPEELSDSCVFTSVISSG